jgi:hypothetical protein
MCVCEKGKEKQRGGREGVSLQRVRTGRIVKRRTHFGLSVTLRPLDIVCE